MQIFKIRRPRVQVSEEARKFWKKVDRGHPMDCWNWLGGRNNVTGYGETGGVNSMGAHRKAFEISGGELIDGMVIMHLCDNRRCCNPAHLRQGTYRDNVHDAIRKGSHRGRVCYATREEAAEAVARKQKQRRDNPIWREKERLRQRQIYQAMKESDPRKYAEHLQKSRDRYQRRKARKGSE